MGGWELSITSIVISDLIMGCLNWVSLLVYLNNIMGLQVYSLHPPIVPSFHLPEVSGGVQLTGRSD